MRVIFIAEVMELNGGLQPGETIKVRTEANAFDSFESAKDWIKSVTSAKEIVDNCAVGEFYGLYRHEMNNRVQKYSFMITKRIL